MSIGVFLGAGSVAVLAVLAFFYLLRSNSGARRTGAGSPLDSPNLGWLRYRPMLRLLSEADYEFLEKQPGYDPQVARQLRRERRKIFRQYLHRLSKDFYRLHRAARFLAVQSPEPRPELNRVLIQQLVEFTLAMYAVRTRLLVSEVGLSGVRVDVRPLVHALEGLQLQLAAVPVRG